jgi:hypothetical protein
MFLLGLALAAIGVLCLAKDISTIRKNFREGRSAGVAELLQVVVFGKWGLLGVISLIVAAFVLGGIGKRL